MNNSKRALDKLSLRDNLAIDRTKMANERTYLAYIRTALVLLGLGITLIKLFPETTILFYTGIISIPIAILICIGASFQCTKISKKLKYSTTNKTATNDK